MSNHRIPFQSRANPDAGNIFVSYSPDEDDSAANAGFKFLGVAKDATGAEIHIFEMQPLPQG